MMEERMNVLKQKQTAAMKKVAQDALDLQCGTLVLGATSLVTAKELVKADDVPTFYTAVFYNPAMPNLRSAVRLTCNKYDTESNALAGVDNVYLTADICPQSTLALSLSLDQAKVCSKLLNDVIQFAETVQSHAYLKDILEGYQRW